MKNKRLRFIRTLFAVEVAVLLTVTAFGFYIVLSDEIPPVMANSISGIIKPSSVDAKGGPAANPEGREQGSGSEFPEQRETGETPPHESAVPDENLTEVSGEGAHEDAFPEESNASDEIDAEPSGTDEVVNAVSKKRPTMIFCGDILIDGSVKNVVEREGLDIIFRPEYRGPFRNADIAMADLEMPVSTRGAPMLDKEYNFRGDPSSLDLLEDMGIDIVTVANNHTMDYGREAFTDTLDLLDERGIKYVGGGRDKNEAERWVTLKAGDYSVAFLAATRVISSASWYAAKNQPGVFGTYDPSVLNAQIALAKQEADYVVVYAHWGVEKNSVPEDYQRDMARGYVNAGADLVVACHPHVLQSLEFYKGTLIAYSLGNFIFTDSQKDTAALEVTINEDGGLSARLRPFEIVDRRTAPMTNPNKLENLRKHLNEISFGVTIGEDFEIRPKLD